MYVISDYKTVSVYAFLLGEKPEWERQLNCYRWLAEQNGFKISRLEIVALLRDWQVSKSKVEKDYPEKPMLVVPVKMWPLEEADEYVRSRTDLHRMYEATPDDDLPVCTPEERWARPDKWAVKKKGNKRALRVFDTEEEAQAYVVPAGPKFTDMEIEHRPGEDVRCQSYCRVARYCSYWQEKYGGEK